MSAVGLPTDAMVWRAYKSEITDWCGHQLAIELTAEKLGLSQEAVRRVIARHDISEIF